MPKNEKPSYIGHRERIREKFVSAGLDSFLDHETLELLLTYAVARKDTKPIAWALLKRFGSLAAVLDAETEQLAQVKGVGPQTALFIKLIRGVFKKYTLDEVKERVTIRTPQQVLEYCKASLAGKKEESLEVIYLSVRNTVMGTQVLASGLIDRVAVSPRKIVESALAAKASAFILVHNHPSGDASPSQEDILFTHDIIRAAKLFDISVHDHIIIGGNSHYSMKANGII